MSITSSNQLSKPHRSLDVKPLAMTLFMKHVDIRYGARLLIGIETS